MRRVLRTEDALAVRTQQRRAEAARRKLVLKQAEAERDRKYHERLDAKAAYKQAKYGHGMASSSSSSTAGPIQSVVLGPGQRVQSLHSSQETAPSSSFTSASAAAATPKKKPTIVKEQVVGAKKR